ncbi:MAG: hypothetical protein B6241_04665 [Spirochaetaceae bacterium 4572_59]|nr:MAG: hypothetical protein B6241_04665 [Spirochaetaceae bacterium 4572_59]
MKTVIIHGHFYQPPRENPWSGIIEDQPTAYPYDNWNQKIQEECYQSNCWSPVLNGEGQVVCQFNNYDYISFNFGPTLLSWIKEYASASYEKIRKADRNSIYLNKGHGNAMAQVYNHIIMPLANEKDRITQIEWGIKDFQHHFERDPEGMWLAETAIHPETAEELVKAGIKYTVLSPWQADLITKNGSDTIKAENRKELWQHPWIIPCPSGDLTVFFYHPGLSSDISFQHLLRDANLFYSRVNQELDDPGTTLLSIATDGEIYGHHEKWGNMGLSAFISKVLADDSLCISNFAARMDMENPAGTVGLQKGEDEKGSSWSCSHGVSRWYKDCGCNTGGKEEWDQAWRTPLRDGLNSLSNETDRIYEKEMARLTGRDPWEVRNKYIEVLLNPSKANQFYKENGPGKKSLSDRNLFFSLLEGQKNKMFMFTSCGWFFSDIAGIEARQNLMYAARTIDLYSLFFSISQETTLLDYLSDAESNDITKGNAAVLYTSQKFVSKKQEFKLIASIILSHFYDLEDLGDRQGFFKTISYKSERTGEVLHAGEIIICNFLTRSRKSYRFEILADRRLFTRMTVICENKSCILYPEEMPLSFRISLMKHLSISRNTSSQSISDRFYDMVSQLNEMMCLGMPNDNSLKESLDALLYFTLREITYLMGQEIEGSWMNFQEIVKTAAKWEISLPKDLTLWLRDILEKGINRWSKKDLHNRAEWERAYKKLKVILNPSWHIPGIPLTHTQTGRICDVLLHSEEGVRILNSRRDDIRDNFFQILNLAADFHPHSCGVSETDKS